MEDINVVKKINGINQNAFLIIVILDIIMIFSKKNVLKNANLILNGEVRIGFTKAMCKEAWGEPSYINNTISSYGTWEQWVYGLGSYLYFNGNKLVVIQN